MLDLPETGIMGSCELPNVGPGSSGGAVGPSLPLSYLSNAKLNQHFEKYNLAGQGSVVLVMQA